MAFKHLALLALAALGACASQSDAAYLPLQGIPAHFDLEVRTARPGELLLTQDAVIPHVARPTAAASDTIAFDLMLTKTFSIDESAVLYKVNLVENGDYQVYCLPEAAENFFNPDIRGCFADEDADGDFDRLWWMYEDSGLRWGAGNLNAATELLEAETPYVSEGRLDLFPLRVSVRFDDSLRPGGGVFSLVLNDGEKDFAIRLTRDFVHYEGNEVKAISVLGVAIEVISVDETRIQYRILNGLPTDRLVGFSNQASHRYDFIAAGLAGGLVGTAIGP